MELALDSNPVCQNPFYRQKLLEELGGLRHLDLKRVTEEERSMMQQLQQQRRAKERAVGEAHLEWNAELQRKREQDARPPSRSALFALSVKDGRQNSPRLGSPADIIGDWSDTRVQAAREDQGGREEDDGEGMESDSDEAVQEACSTPVFHPVKKNGHAPGSILSGDVEGPGSGETPEVGEEAGITENEELLMEKGHVVDFVNGHLFV